MSTFYTGVGSRKTPENILGVMEAFAAMFSLERFVLRSGAAPGADTAFETGCNVHTGPKEIYLPWKNFMKHDSSLFNISQEVFEVAGDIYGPSWKYLKRTTKLLMARDVQQVLGQYLDVPSDFVICWTPDGCLTKAERTRKTGGTGQAIATAYENDIPVFNLQREGQQSALLEFLKEAYNV